MLLHLNVCGKNGSLVLLVCVNFVHKEISDYVSKRDRRHSDVGHSGISQVCNPHLRGDVGLSDVLPALTPRGAE